MRGVDVTRVVFFVGHKLDSILLVRDDITKTVALQVFGQSCRRDDAVRPLLRHLLVLGEDPLLLQLQLQGLTLGVQMEKEEGLVLKHQAIHHLLVTLWAQQGFRYSDRCFTENGL